MSDVDVICDCGHAVRMSEFAIGMPATCPACQQALDYSMVRPVAATGPAPLDSFAAPPADASPARPNRPSASVPGAVAPPPRAPDPAPRGRTECVRCGRRFRGEWDIHETSKGPLCHICANRVADVVPQETPSNTVAPVASIFLAGTREAAGLEHIDLPSEAPPKKKLQFDPQHPTFRKLLWGAAIGMIALTVVLFMTEDMTPPSGDNYDADSNSAANNAMGKLPFALVLVVESIFSVAGTVLTLYLTLWYRNKLPMDSWWGNALHVGVVSIGLGLVLALLALVPAPGGMPIGGICALLIVFWVCSAVYDFGFMDYVTFYALGIPASIIVHFSHLLVLGAIANIFI